MQQWKTWMLQFLSLTGVVGLITVSVQWCCLYRVYRVGRWRLNTAQLSVSWLSAVSLCPFSTVAWLPLSHRVVRTTTRKYPHHTLHGALPAASLWLFSFGPSGSSYNCGCSQWPSFSFPCSSLPTAQSNSAARRKGTQLQLVDKIWAMWLLFPERARLPTCLYLYNKDWIHIVRTLCFSAKTLNNVFYVSCSQYNGV